MASRKELLAQVYKLIPPMLESFHKGQLGRVAVIGGSEDYTGAPYFSAMASARLGADMSHVICEPAAAAVIKTYSPILMVHPYMRSEQSLEPPPSGTTTETINDAEFPKNLDKSAQRVIDMLDRLHVLVIGPGLGRDRYMQEICARVIIEARKRGMPFVLDADGLFLATTRPELIHGYTQCILTPNVVEFARLAKSKGLDLDGSSHSHSHSHSRSHDQNSTTGADDNNDDADKSARCERLAEAFGGVTIIQKGETDYISNGSHTLASSGKGGLKRAGGQGDTLTGCLATLLAYRKAYHDKLWSRGDGTRQGDGTTNGDGDGDGDGEEMSPAQTLALVAYGGSAITRECSRLAYEERGRSLQAGDLTGFVHRAFLDIVGEPTAGLRA